jgi:TonB-linked SusC/RagA family outer membrane protein
MRLTRLKALAGRAVALALLVGSATAAQAQQASITGRVTDNGSGEPIPEARVMVVGTNRFSITNAEGRYTIRGVPEGAAEVRVLRVGFQEQKKPVTIGMGATITLDFTMNPVALRLTELVVTATGETRNVEQGNQIAQIDAAKVVETQPIANVGDLLTARAPGVMVLPSNMTGSGARIRIRGTHSLSLANSPIYVIDGVRMTSTASASTIGVGGSTPSRVNDLNPEEIENIEVVKGPSAATLYGTDAANGVIVVTTKRGRAGAPRWSTYAEAGLVQQRNAFPTAYSGWAGGTLSSRCFLSDVGAGACTLDSLTSFNLFDDRETTPFGNGWRQQYGAQLSGGNEMIRYFTSAEWEEETGPMKTPEFALRQLDSTGLGTRPEWRHPNALTRSSVRLNLSVSPNQQLDLGLQTGFIKLDQRLPFSDNNTYGLFSHAYGGPGYKSSDRAGWLGLGTYGYRALNPGEIFQYTSRDGVNRFIGSTNVNWRPTSWLQNRANVGLDYAAQTDVDICGNGQCPANSTTALQRSGFADDNRLNRYSYTVDLGSSASFAPKTWMTSKTTVGAQYVYGRVDANYAYGGELPPGSTTINGAVTQAVSQATALSKTLGFFIEEAVGINDRLFLTGAVRSDRNNAFGTNFQRVYYPKLSASWIVSEEGFFPSFSWLNQLRLRSAFGASGVQPSANDAIMYYSPTLANVDRKDRPGLVLGAFGNPNLKPERATEFEGGFDARALDNRVSLELTYYSTLTKDALIARKLAPSSGSSSIRENLGSVKNAGLEGLINAQLLDRAQLGWDVTLSGNTNANKLVSLGDTPVQELGTIREISGYPVHGWWDREYTYSDADNNGIISADEVVVNTERSFLGYSTPRYEAVLTNGLDLLGKKFRLQAMVDYKGGYKIENVTEEFRCDMGIRRNCQALWDPKASLADQARVVAYNVGMDAQGNPLTTYAGFIEDGSFIRFRELSLAYTPAESFARKYLRARSASFSFAVRNLGFLMKNYSGIDPEMNYGQSDVQNEFQTSPTPTYMTFRVNVGF